TEIPEYVEMIGRLRSDGVTAIPMIAGAYPKKLLELEDPPATLFCRGNQLLLNRTDCVAIVGTREPSDFGAKMSFALGRRFAMAGFVVVSGLAFGIDAAAHRGALEGGGATMAVLPSYVGNIVPKGNANIAERILNSGGALVSEYPPGAPVLKENFVARNRIIAALASSTIVVEGTLRSGTRHQARFARRLDRPLFVLAPRDRSAPAAELPLYLMEREGAKPVTNEVDALQEIRKAIESYCYQVTLE
ncbi:MAG: DNA-processing protein DprA, partial [Candidatus Thorarchaeota archaeon]